MYPGCNSTITISVQPLGSPPIPKTVVGHFELPYWGKLSKQEVNQQNKILIEYLSKRLNG
jgi:hypothetical protein